MSYKAEAFALYFALRDSAISKYANFLIAAMVAYAFSLIDLISDLFWFLVSGWSYLDVMPLGIASVTIPFLTVIVSLLPTPYNETHLEMLACYPRLEAQGGGAWQR